MSPRHAAPLAAPPSTEHARLAESPLASSPWRLWGPYLAGRQWGTVREDYSADGDAWAYLPFEQAHRRAYRWGEDGLGGLSDRYGFLNFSVALWNERDEILKERLFGLANGEGNHGEDVKEYWWALDGTPTHSWMRWRYRYPQAAFPYQQLRAENARRSRQDREYELADTGVLDGNRFFDVTVSYAKATPTDIAIVVEATNHGPEAAPLHLLPQLWFHNTWAWGRDARRPWLRRLDASGAAGPDASGATGPDAPDPSAPADPAGVECWHSYLGRYLLIAETIPRADGQAGGQAGPDVLVCDNETNFVSLFGTAENPTRYTKDGIGRRVIHGETGAVNPDGTGTKAAFWYRFAAVAPGQTVRLRLRLTKIDADDADADSDESADAAADTAPAPVPDADEVPTFTPNFDTLLAERAREADEFYAEVIPASASDEDRHIARRAYAGLLWGKQVYRYSVAQWLDGDPATPAPPPQREHSAARNIRWRHLALADVISMPDEWEYPWFAAWDLAFHCVTLAHVDPAFAKEQLLLLCREWAMHPDGQLPAYEWSFSDANPPVHAWAAWQVYLIDGGHDTDFLVRVFTKILLTFGWWVNRKDPDGTGIFAGGFLGMDNIGLFDRSAVLPGGSRLEQSDATSWMAFLCLNLLTISLELATRLPAWDELATKFLRHFLDIAHAMRNFGSHGVALWNEDDGFYYDVLARPGADLDTDADDCEQLRVRSMVGLLPLLAVAHAPDWMSEALPDFSSRLRWLRKRRPELLDGLLTDTEGRHLLSLLDADRLRRVLSRLLDEGEFLGAYGIRSLSAAYATPYVCEVGGEVTSIEYTPGESTTALFGGNSNWRGPIWFPVNVLLADALRSYGSFYGDDLTVELPAGSGQRVPLDEVADALDERLIALFRRGPDGRRPCDGQRIEASADPLWAEHLSFNEYFHGDTGEGLGASHQTGWTALVAHLICRVGACDPHAAPVPASESAVPAPESVPASASR